jgi:hypothetical protein
MKQGRQKGVWFSCLLKRVAHAGNRAPRGDSRRATSAAGLCGLLLRIQQLEKIGVWVVNE